MILEIIWEVDDGYLGKNRPQTLTVNTDDYVSDKEWNEMSEFDKKEKIDEWVTEDFDNVVSFNINTVKTIE